MMGCQKSDVQYSQKSYVFGTMVEITILDVPESKAKEASNEVLKTFDNLHQELHAWNNTSQLSILNQQVKENKLQNIQTTKNIINLMTISKKYDILSNGLFNPAIGNLIQLWGFQSDNFKAELPNPDKIQQLINQKPSLQQINFIDASKYLLRVSNPNIKIDFGGVAKGYALDLAQDILKKHQIKNALINIGGNILAMGQHGNRPWQVGLQNPRKPSVLGVISLEDGEAIGTSGDYQRYFEFQNQRYCHIINPKTGYPATESQSVTVLISPKKLKSLDQLDRVGIISDVVSKPIFINPDFYKNNDKNLDNLNVSGVLIVDKLGNIFINDFMKSRINLK